MAAKKHKKQKQDQLLPVLYPVLAGVLAASALTIILMILTAVLLRYSAIDAKWVTLINQVIKVISICLAAALAVRGGCQKPWFRGGFAGGLYIIVGMAVFSFVLGSFNLSISILLDLLMGILIGAVVGAILGNREK